MPSLAAKIRAKYPNAYTDLSDADLEAQVLAKHPEYKDLATPEQDTHGALSLAAASRGLPGAATAAEEFVTNPNVPKVAAKFGRVVGGIAPVVGGAVEAGPAGAAMGLAAASKGAWAGGKTGWFSGKLAQDVTTPMARGLARIAPYAKAVGTASGVQGGLDLAQIAEPSRRDIGFMGVGSSTPHDAEHQAMLNALYEAIRARLRGGK